MENNTAVPILVPVDPEVFWERIRSIVEKEINKLQKEPADTSTIFQTPGLTYKPLYKIQEICVFFQVTRQTIYDWIKHGKLKPYKIQSRVYFLYNDIQKLLQP